MAKVQLGNVLSSLRLHPNTPGSIVNAWTNDDIRPLPPARRKWTTWTFMGWWAVWMMALSNFQIGSSMVAVGMSVWQAMIAVILGRIIIAAMAVLNGYPGAEWHIGFPVFSRMVWGMRGSFMVVFMRILLGLVGFAVQSWSGGLCATAVLGAIFPSFYNMRNTLPASSHLTTSQLVGWLVFLLICLPLIYIRPERASRVMIVMNTLTLITLLSILIWSLAAAHGAGPLLSQASVIQGSSNTGWAIVGGVNNVIGSVAPALMSQSDFSRFARKPRDQVWGQIFAFVVLGTIMPLFGCLVSSATAKIYGQPIWNPPNIILAWLANHYGSGTRAAATFAGFGLGVSQLATVIVDNAYSLGIDLSAVFPTYINIRRGSYVGLVLGMALCPWELLSTATIFLTVISSFTVFFGPVCGVQVCDYFLVRRRRVKLSELYTAESGTMYYYFMGFNWRSFVSWIVGWAPLFPGLLHAIKPTISISKGGANLYNIAFMLGFTISFSVYYFLNSVFPPPGLGEIDPLDEFGTFTPEEAAHLGVLVHSPPESIDGIQEETSIKGEEGRSVKTF